MSNRFLTTNQLLLAHHGATLGLTPSFQPSLMGIRLTLTNSHSFHTFPPRSFGINSRNSIRLSRHKQLSNELLARHGLPIPTSISIGPLTTIGYLPPFPLVVKPAIGEKGHHVYTKISNRRELVNLTRRLFEHQSQLIIQSFVEGDNDRFLVINHRVVSVARRYPPTIMGDGQRTILELIELHNARLTADAFDHNYRHPLGKDQQIGWHLRQRGLGLNSILSQGEELMLFPIANFQAGGSVLGMPLSAVPKRLIRLAEKVSRVFGMSVCGVDMIVPKDPARATIIEVNSFPSLRLHQLPNYGQSSQVTEHLLNFIFSS